MFDKLIKKENIFLLVIIIIALFLRLWNLGQIPVSMSDDEVRLTYSAFSLWNTGKDLNGNTLPLFFLIDGYAFNPVSIYLTSMFVGLFNINMFTARLPFALAGFASVVLLYFISNQLFKNKVVSYISALALSFSVWHLQLSRFAYEGSMALVFYILGIFLFLKVKKNNFFFLVFSMVSFLLAFYSYSGMKLIFLPIVFLLIWFKYKDLKLKQFIIVALFIFFTFSSFFILSKVQNAASYGGRLFFFQDVTTAAFKVELERRASPSPDFLEKLYHNKITYWSKIFAERYSYAFSPQYLLNSQEGSGIFSLWFRGQLYYIDAIFIFLGILYLFTKYRREFFLLLMFIIIAPIASGLGPDPVNYTIRSSFMVPWLMILIACGIYSITYFIKNKILIGSIYLVTIVAYVYFIGGYLNQYYYEWPRYSAKFYSQGAKNLISVINENKNKNMIVIDRMNSMYLLHYAFYNNLSPSVVQQNYRNKNVKLNNILFKENCINLVKKNPRKLISEGSMYIIPFECPDTKKGTKYAYNPDMVIRSPDEEDQWLIYNK